MSSTDLVNEFVELYIVLRKISYGLETVSRNLKEMRTKQKVLVCERCNIPKIDREIVNNSSICRDCVLLIYS